MSDEKTRFPRRSVLRLLGGLLGILGTTILIGPVIAYFWPAKLEEIPSEPVPVGAPDQVPANGSITVRFGRYPALIVNTPDGLRAYSAVCTHFACLVKWNPDAGMIECPCHAGYFNVSDGSVISGPPPEGLMPLNVYVENDVLYVGGEA
jgi:cytochrome b6-f complex iron-sulfur subunit